MISSEYLDRPQDIPKVKPVDIVGINNYHSFEDLNLAVLCLITASPQCIARQVALGRH
jgi:hypothetical protein